MGRFSVMGEREIERGGREKREKRREREREVVGQKFIFLRGVSFVSTPFLPYLIFVWRFLRSSVRFARSLARSLRYSSISTLFIINKTSNTRALPGVLKQKNLCKKKTPSSTLHFEKKEREKEVYFFLVLCVWCGGGRGSGVERRCLSLLRRGRGRESSSSSHFSSPSSLTTNHRNRSLHLSPSPSLFATLRATH